jgi:hypothetical protein
MLPRAVELLAAEGITESHLRDQCRVPADLFRTVTSRTPDPAPSDGDADPARSSRVTSLFR